MKPKNGSEKDFKERFKGKSETIGKDGHLAVVAATRIPIQKVHRSGTDSEIKSNNI